MLWTTNEVSTALLFKSVAPVRTYAGQRTGSAVRRRPGATVATAYPFSLDDAATWRAAAENHRLGRTLSQHHSPLHYFAVKTRAAFDDPGPSMP
jgi:hypothetical protein